MRGLKRADHRTGACGLSSTVRVLVGTVRQETVRTCNGRRLDERTCRIVDRQDCRPAMAEDLSPLRVGFETHEALAIRLTRIMMEAA